MDPIGFALENFDLDRPVARRRRRRRQSNASGTLLDGTPIDGPGAYAGA